MILSLPFTLQGKRELSAAMIFLLMIVFSVSASARKGRPGRGPAAFITVTGRVTSAEDQEALAGVSVTVSGAATGTSTAANGSYTINVPANATLVFSFVGFE